MNYDARVTLRLTIWVSSEYYINNYYFIFVLITSFGNEILVIILFLRF